LTDAATKVEEAVAVDVEKKAIKEIK